MFLNYLVVLADNAPDPGASAGNPLTTLFPFLLIIPLFYLLMIRPARRQEKERQSLIGNTKKNDKVVTSSGIIGTIVSFGDDEVVIKVDDNVRLRMLKGSIARNITQEEALKAQASPNGTSAKTEEAAKEPKAAK